MNQKDCLALPPGAQAYKRTPVFTQDTVPAGLLRDHVTREGTWALIHVLEGVVRYRVPGLDVEQDLHPAAAPGVVLPQMPHSGCCPFLCGVLCAAAAGTSGPARTAQHGSGGMRCKHGSSFVVQESSTKPCSMEF